MSFLEMDCLDQKGYDHGLFGCLADPKACLLSFLFCCPCVQCTSIGVYVGKAEKSKFNFISCMCPQIGAYRLRRNNVDRMAPHDKQSMDGSMLAIACCGCCSLSQDIHEVRKRLKESERAAIANPPESVPHPSTFAQSPKQ